MEKEINIEIIIELLKSSVGIEAAEKFIYDAVEDASLQEKKFYSEEEFKKICESLKKKGGYIATFSTVLLTPEYREKYYELLVNKEREEKEKILSWYRELQHTYKELEETKDKLVQSEKLAAVGRLASVVSHELKNPLAVMKSIQYFLRKKITGDAQIERFLKMLDDEINSANKIILDLLSFTQVKKLAKTPTRIVPLIEDVLNSLLLSNVIDEQRVKIKKNYDFDTEIVIDPQRIKQVIQNIVINAVQSISKTGTLTITTQVATDYPCLSEHNTSTTDSNVKWSVMISISDDGCGIKKENREHTFEPFHTTKTKGTGLGLFIAKDIIDAHNGKIVLESEEGKGTKFTLFL